MVARVAGNEVSRLRDLVRERGIESASSLVGFPKGTVSKWVNGRHAPNPSSIHFLRDRLPPEAPLRRADDNADRFQAKPDRLRAP